MIVFEDDSETKPVKCTVKEIIAESSDSTRLMSLLGFNMILFVYITDAFPLTLFTIVFELLPLITLGVGSFVSCLYKKSNYYNKYHIRIIARVFTDGIIYIILFAYIDFTLWKFVKIVAL